MRTLAASFLAGLVFAIGLGVAGMTRPGKVAGFLDLTGAWDPSLAMVMVGAIGVYAVAARALTPLERPEETGCAPAGAPITAKLLIGSAIFGVGWGLSGYCPGPALVSLAGLGPGVVVFVGAMLGGMKLASLLGAQSE